MKKIFLVILLVLALSITFVACGEHEHEFDDKWTYDANNHWHVATCDDTDDVADEAPHDFGCVIMNNIRTCLVCGYSENVSPIKPEPPHEHTYATEFSANADGHFRVATCEHADEVTDSAPHTYVDGICTECEWWSSATDVLIAQVSKLDVWDYALSFNDIVINNVNLLSEGIEHDSYTVSGELKLRLSVDGLFSGCGYIVLNDELSVKAVVNENAVYAIVHSTGDEGNKYIRCQLDELFAQSGVDVSQITSYVDEFNANTQQVRDLVAQIESVVKYLPKDKISQLISQLVTVDDEQSANGLTAYVVNCDVLRNFNERLATATVADFVDTAYGEEGFFANLPAFVEGLFDMRVNEVFDLIEKNFGLTFDEVFELIDSLIADYYPDKNVNTIDQLLAAMGKPLPAPIKTLVTINKYSRLGFLLETSQIFGDTKLRAEDIVAKVQEFCNAYGDKTIYQIILGDNDDMTVDDLKQSVDDAADKLEATPVTMFVDGDGVLQRISAGGENGEIVLSRGQDLTQDYSHVIDDVNASANAAD